MNCPKCEKPMQTFIQNRIDAGDPVVDAVAKRSELKLPVKALLHVCHECNHREVNLIELTP